MKVVIKCTDGCTYFGQYVNENNESVVLNEVEYMTPENKGDFFKDLDLNPLDLNGKVFKFPKTNIVWYTR